MRMAIFLRKGNFFNMMHINGVKGVIYMNRSGRVDKKIVAYSYICKSLGIINEAELKQIKTGVSSKKRQHR